MKEPIPTFTEELLANQNDEYIISYLDKLLAVHLYHNSIDHNVFTINITKPNSKKGAFVKEGIKEFKKWEIK